MKIKKSKIIIISLILVLNLLILFHTQTTKAMDEPVSMENLRTFAEDDVKLQEYKDPNVIAIEIINIVLGLLGLIFLILIIISGFQWMTSGGNEENIAKAKKRLTGAVIGLLIVLCSYIIANWIMGTIQRDTEDAIWWNNF